MDWAKIDAELAGALDQAGDADLIAVFVHLAPDAEAWDEDVAPLNGHGAVRTGTITPAQVSDLTDQPWVNHVRWSGPLRLLDDPGGG